MGLILANAEFDYPAPNAQTIAWQLQEYTGQALILNKIEHSPDNTAVIALKMLPAECFELSIETVDDDNRQRVFLQTNSSSSGRLFSCAHQVLIDLGGHSDFPPDTLPSLPLSLPDIRKQRRRNAAVQSFYWGAAIVTLPLVIPVFATREVIRFQRDIRRLRKQIKKT